MSVLQAAYFDGGNSLKHEVSVLIGGGKVRLVGRDISLEFEARKVRVAPRLADTPRWIYLPGGGACVFADNDSVDGFSRERRFPRILNRLESLPAVAAVAVVLVMLSLWLLIDRGVPPAVQFIAERIPRGAESTLGDETLAALDENWMHPSRLKPARQQALRSKFADMARSAGETGPLRLEFRASPIGANAFALPSGIIVVTDDLVRLARNDNQVLAVLAHEIGHVRYRHTMRHLLESSATALIIAAVTGDIASTTSLAASAPALLLQTKYSRDYEREADRFAIDLLQRTNINPQNFAAILERLEKKHGKGPGPPTFLSSHPPTAEREALARASAGASAGDKAVGDDTGRYDERLANVRPERPALAIIDPEQRQIADLLEKRDYPGLERILGGRQLAFESDPSTAGQLEQAFQVFGKLPRRSEAALNEWVKTAPSYSARVARGGFYLSRGIEERGADYSSDTSSEHIDAMEVYFDESLDDLEHSLKLSQKPYLGRRYMMTIMLYTGSRDELKANYVEALRFAPGSVETRLAYMRSLEPRWGGSYQQMEAYLAEARSAVGPEGVRRIAARIQAYHGFERRQAKDFEQAVGHFGAAIQLDPDPQVLCDRAGALGELKRYDEAFSDVGRALGKASEDRYCMDMAVWLAVRVDKPAEVIRVMTAIVEVDPNNGLAYSHRGWSYERQGDQGLAFSDYLAAAKLGEVWAQARVGRAYWTGAGVKRDPEEAIGWLEKAAKQGNVDARANLDEARKALGRPSQ